MSPTRKPHPLAFKPDIEEAARRWDAFYAGEIIDRPVVCVNAWRSDERVYAPNYRQRALGDMDATVDQALARAEAVYLAASPSRPGCPASARTRSPSSAAPS